MSYEREINRKHGGDARSDPPDVADDRDSLLAIALDNTKHGIAMFDVQGRLIICNARYRDIYGFSDEVVRPGVSIEEILKHSVALGNYSQADARRALSERLLQITSREPSIYEQHLRDGRTIAVNHQPLESGLSVTTCEDITEALQREREAAEMSRAAALADAESNAKSAFLANMSHELKTPLNAIIGFAETMQQEMFGPLGNDDYQGYASSIVDGATQLMHIIDQMLEMADLYGDGAGLEEECFDLAQTVKDIAQDFAPQVDGKQLSLRLALDDRPMWILGDTGKLKRAISAVLDNAVKFSPPGGLVVVSVWSSEPDGLTISISDAGPGIPAERIAHLLSPFGQDEAVEVRVHHGAGLGLPIAEGLIRLHGGRLELESRPGVGTVVNLSLPGERLVRGGAMGRSPGAGGDTD